MEVKGKNILITGGFGGIGLGIAKSLKELGANIFIFDLKTSNEFESFKVDVTSENEVRRALSSIDKIDILINCAGEIYSEPFLRFTAKDDKRHSRISWERVIQNNLTSAFNMCVQVSEKMFLKRIKGLIINFSSVSAKGNIGQVAYASAKAGVEAMTKVIARELGSLKIRAVAIAPGFIDTPSTKKAISENMLEGWIQQTPLKQLGKMEDIIETVKYIIACDHISGCVVHVDGGLSL